MKRPPAEAAMAAASGTGPSLALGPVIRRPKRVWGQLKEIASNHELLRVLAWREIKVRYKQSVMGILWAVLMPILIVMAGILVRLAFSNLSGEPLELADIGSVSVKAVPWAFIVTSIRVSSASLIGNGSLLTKIYLPRVIFPIAAVASQLVDLAVATLPLTVVLALAGFGASVHLLWLPIIVLLIVLIPLSWGIAISAAGLFFRDVKYLVEVFITFAIFFTPVFYDVEMFGRWSDLLMLNPFAPVLEALNRVVVLQQAPELGWLAYSAVWAVGGSVLALRFFRRVEPYFAESV